MQRTISVASGILAVVVACAPAGAVSPAPLSPCPVPAGVSVVRLPEGLPPALLAALQPRLSARIALPNQPFNSTDVIVEDYPGSRFAFVWKRGDRWIVAAERGGIAYEMLIFVYAMSENGQNALLRETRDVRPESICAVAAEIARK